MKANVVCKEDLWHLQGYASKSVAFRYVCPKCGGVVRGSKYCPNCGIEIEYPPKPNNYEVYERQGKWYVSYEERKRK